MPKNVSLSQFRPFSFRWLIIFSLYIFSVRIIMAPQTKEPEEITKSTGSGDSGSEKEIGAGQNGNLRKRKVPGSEKSSNGEAKKPSHSSTSSNGHLDDLSDDPKKSGKLNTAAKVGTVLLVIFTIGYLCKFDLSPLET